MPGISKHKAARRSNVALATASKRLRLENQENIDPRLLHGTSSQAHISLKETLVAETCNREIQAHPIMVHASVQCEDPVMKVTDVQISGRRLVGLASLAETMRSATLHAGQCKKGPVAFKGSTKKGMTTSVYFSCGCGKTFKIGSDDEKVTMAANDALAWGCQVSATGFESATQLLTTFDLPTPNRETFKKRQDTLYDTLGKTVKLEMQKWAKVEYDLAIEKGEFVEINGVKYAAITVVLDGGWAKRSYGHSFSSSCGVAVIIGARTRKVIYADTRISSCIICDRVRKEGDPTPEHKCYKNWNKAPTGMESDILLEGFKSSISSYNLVYNRFIGDGDSSVYSKVINAYDGIRVEKVECMNHLVKNLTSRLMEISRNQVRGNEALKIPLEERRCINTMLPRIRTGVRRAIIYNNQQKNHWKALQEDILNVLKHVFGEHTDCKSYFCDKAKPNEKNVYYIAKKMVCFDPLQKAIKRVADHSSSLIHALTSNPAESFMSVAAKYTEGKRKNFGQRYLYNLRMYGAVFSYNESTFWAAEAYQLINGCSPHKLWISKEKAFVKRRSVTRKYKVSKPLKFPTFAVEGDWDYGSEPARPPMAPDIRSVSIKNKHKELQVSPEQQAEIEMATKLQANSPRWKMERAKGRLTASKSGRICKLRDSTDNTDVLNDILGRKRVPKIVQIAMAYGTEHEETAVKEYELLMGFPAGTVQKAGLFVDLKHGELAASPDGLIGDDGLLEVKCPYNLFLNKRSAESWPETSTLCGFTRTGNATYEIKPNHDHYYQMVMQLHITGRLWCDYMVWSENGSVIIRLHKDSRTEAVWINMCKKLIAFWENDFAPELVDSCFARGSKEYYCPANREESRRKKLKKSCTVKNK